LNPRQVRETNNEVSKARGSRHHQDLNLVFEMTVTIMTRKRRKQIKGRDSESTAKKKRKGVVPIVISFSHHFDDEKV